MNADQITAIREAIAEAVEESIRNHENGGHFDAVIIRRDGSVDTLSSEAALTALAHGREGIGNVVGSWTWEQTDYEAGEEIDKDGIELANEALYQQWNESD